LQQLVKLLCAQNRPEEAIRILDERNWQVRPDRYKIPIQVEIYLAKGEFKTALSALRAVSTSDEHLVGLKRKVYLRWARHEQRELERKRIANEGLSVPLDHALRRNIPIMVTTARLAVLAEDFVQYEQLLGEITRVNANVGQLLRDEEEDVAYWEQEAFDV
jgi:hypothetical protein